VQTQTLRIPPPPLYSPAGKLEGPGSRTRAQAFAAAKAAALGGLSADMSSTMKVIVIAGTQSGVGKVGVVVNSLVALDSPFVSTPALVLATDARLTGEQYTHSHVADPRAPVVCGAGPHGSSAVRQAHV
jgi:hypothetical protein